MRVTIVQANQIWEDKTANFNNYMRLLEGVETDLILLPEMFQTGFTMNTKELAELFGQSVSIKWLKDIASTKDTAIYTSLIIEENGNYYNRGVFVLPQGAVVYYDKRKTFSLAHENDYFESGLAEQIVEYKGFRINLQICYDLRFPELIRNRVLTDGRPAYDVLLYVANWPTKRSLHWRSLLVARAIENQCYVFGCNRVGSDALGLEYTGDSATIDALGNRTEISPGEELAQTFVINLSELSKIREMLPFLKDR